MKQLELIFANLKRFSIQAVVLLTAFNMIYLGLPTEIQSQLPSWVAILINLGLGVFGYIGRQMPQPVVESQIKSLETAIAIEKQEGSI